MLARDPEGVAAALAGLLHHKICLDVPVGLLYIRFDLIAQVADDEDKLRHPGTQQALDDVAQDGISRHGNQRLWLRVRVRTQPRADTGHRDYCFHKETIGRACVTNIGGRAVWRRLLQSSPSGSGPLPCHGR